MDNIKENFNKLRRMMSLSNLSRLGGGEAASSDGATAGASSGAVIDVVAPAATSPSSSSVTLLDDSSTEQPRGGTSSTVCSTHSNAIAAEGQTPTNSNRRQAPLDFNEPNSPLFIPYFRNGSVVSPIRPKARSPYDAETDFHSDDDASSDSSITDDRDERYGSRSSLAADSSTSDGELDDPKMSVILDNNPWHARFSHLASNSLLKKMSRNDHPYIDVANLKCEQCVGPVQAMGGEQTGFVQLLEKAGSVEKDAVIDLVHSAIIGPFSPSTVDNLRHTHLLTMVDDYSRYVTIIPMTDRNHVLQSMDKFAGSVQKQFYDRIGSIRAEKSLDFKKQPLSIHLLNKGIKYERLAKSFGVATQVNQILSQVIPILLNEAGLDSGYWLEAANYAVYTLNRLTNPITRVTPFENWYMDEPPADLSHLRVFGCRFGESGIFLGYNDNPSDELTYRIYQHEFGVTLVQPNKAECIDFEFPAKENNIERGDAASPVLHSSFVDQVDSEDGHQELDPFSLYRRQGYQPEQSRDAYWNEPSRLGSDRVPTLSPVTSVPVPQQPMHRQAMTIKEVKREIEYPRLPQPAAKPVPFNVLRRNPNGSLRDYGSDSGNISTESTLLTTIKEEDEDTSVLNIVYENLRMRTTREQLQLVQDCNSWFTPIDTPKAVAPDAPTWLNKIWHKRLCHIGLEQIKAMSRLPGYGFLADVSDVPCDNCVHISKGVRTRSNKKHLLVETSAPLELIHMDFGGPFPGTETNEKEYYLTFVDDYSRFMVVKFLESNADQVEMSKKVQEFIGRYQTKSRTIKRVRIYSSLDKFADEIEATLGFNGIVMERAPKSKSIGTKLTGILIQITRRMLTEAGLEPALFWKFAMKYVVHTLNRVISTDLTSPEDDKQATQASLIPFERFYGAGFIPDLTYFRTFGCEVFLYRAENKSERGIMIGYQPGRHTDMPGHRNGQAYGYKIWSRGVVWPVVKRVKFHEFIFPTIAKNGMNATIKSVYLDQVPRTPYVKQKKQPSENRFPLGANLVERDSPTKLCTIAEEPEDDQWESSFLPEPQSEILQTAQLIDLAIEPETRGGGGGVDGVPSWPVDPNTSNRDLHEYIVQLERLNHYLFTTLNRVYAQLNSAPNGD